MEEFWVDSRDMKTKLHAVKWIPGGEVKGILVVVHGMAEHILRYAEMAEFFASQGILVTGIDLLGHGRTAATPDELGYFCDRDAATVLVRDVHRLKKTVQQEYPGIPVFLLGHSMGSFIVRNYIGRYGTGINGAVIVGGNDTSWWQGFSGKLSTDIISIFHGWHYRSRFCTKVTLGPYLERIKNPASTSEWIAKRPEVVKKYDDDPLCGIEFTLNGYHAVAELAMRCRVKEYLDNIPRDLPMLILSGEEDPVGQYGAGVKRMYEKYKAMGIKEISMELIHGDRHEILNEADRFDTYEKIMKFMIGHMA